MEEKRHPLAGKPAPKEMLVDVSALLAAYFDSAPDPQDPSQAVSFGTSGHRGSSLKRTFNEAHILATTQAICEYRKAKGTEGPLFLGRDTHALSEPAERSALEVLAANGVEVVMQSGGGFVPTPGISHAILAHNRTPGRALADGIVVTPSHNPPEDGGFKYNPPNGGPADTDATGWIENRANEILRSGNREVVRLSFEKARGAGTTHTRDIMGAYVMDLPNAVDIDTIRASQILIGADPLGGAAVHYWQFIAEKLGLNLRVVNTQVDPQFGFMTLDHDGKIRMDCSSPAAMASLIALKDDYAIAFGNDADADRHGIVTPSGGLMNPNHFLAVAIDYLCTHRPAWSEAAGIGKTLVSSGLIDRVAAVRGRRVVEVPVGFKWFVPGLLNGSLMFGGEESAGASFLRRDGRVWTTDKDGILLALLAAEITATTGQDPFEHYRQLTRRLGTPHYVRLDQPASDKERQALKRLSADAVKSTTLAGEPIVAKLTKAPGNGATIGGLKVATESGWFAARPSGTEAIYKIYAESFKDEAHLAQLVAEAKQLVAEATAG